MLVLTRKINESIIVGDNISVTVLEVQGNRVRIGITAPRDIAINREEIHLILQKSKRTIKTTTKAN